MNEKTIDVLRGAREMIDWPGAWTKHASATDRDGMEVPLIGPDACSWCATGAIEYIVTVDELPRAVADEAVKSLARTLFPDSMYSTRLPWRVVQQWNDETFREHTEILAAFDAAIERLEQSE